MQPHSVSRCYLHFSRKRVNVVCLSVLNISFVSRDICFHQNVTYALTHKLLKYKACHSHITTSFNLMAPWIAHAPRQQLSVLYTPNAAKVCSSAPIDLVGISHVTQLIIVSFRRCNKVIVVLSPDYCDSDECRFLTTFACSMESCTSILSFF